MNQPQPPHWAKTLLRWLHPENTIEEVEGDLDELYAYSYNRLGKRQALLRYLLNGHYRASALCPPAAK